uniref:Uncharacterized protein n=1 Tax=Globisporangium ultimum (strain ATCC 200006 / CBS 805.95 / DAOM BR144) TaxID=431595 RepID=K3W8Q6_GLOUD
MKDYSDNTSLLRILLVGVLTTTPSFMAILCLDAIPMQYPASGWNRNISTWIRVFCGSFLLAAGICFRLQVFVPAACVNMRKTALVGLVTGCGNCAGSVLIAACWVFPVPFLSIVSMPSFLLFFGSAVVCAIGRQNLSENAKLKSQLERYLRTMNLESNLVLIYPVYSVIFASLTGLGQFSMVFVLPVIKWILKTLLKKTVADLEDLIPVITITIDLFNALYQSKCMQSAGSIWTTIAIISIDAIQNAYSLRRLFEYMHEIEALTNVEIGSQGIVVYALELFETPNQLASEDLLALSVQSCSNISSPMSTQHVELVGKVHSAQLKIQQRSKSKPSLQRSSSIPTTWQGKPAYNAVVPWTSAATPTIDTTRAGPIRTTQVLPLSMEAAIVRHKLTSKEQAALLKRTLELLWKCELLILVEYVESAVPFLYAVYLSILYQLPNAKYYPGMDEITPEKLRGILLSLIIYGFLELSSLLYVHAILKWRFKLSPLHQLAFALENEWLLIQGMFMAWVVIVLQFTLVHYGM